MGPRLSILICTLERRRVKFLKLLSLLLPQLTDEIEVIALWNSGGEIGTLRQTLLEAAQGEYVCFIDDDDEIPDYYCEEILNALGEDYVGFQVQVFNDGFELKRAHHGTQFPVWDEDDKGYYRQVTHLNPVRRELALKGTFKGQMGEDANWAKEVSPHVKTQVYIDKVMYKYYHDTRDSSFGGDEQFKLHLERPVIDNKHFKYLEIT